VIAINERLKRLREDQSGLSFAEILVAVMLSMLILVMVTSFFIQVGKITTNSGQQRDANRNAANISNELTSVLRVASTLPKLNTATADPAIVDGTRSSLTVYALSNTVATKPAPVKITFTLDATGKVTETRCTGTASGNYYTFASCVTSTTRTLGTNVLAPATPTGTTVQNLVDSGQLFTYLDVNGNPFTIGTGSLSATQRATVAKIIVTVRTQATGSTAKPVVVSSVIVLRNIGLDTGTI
jgi:Tfp pilus assembly protein PilW